LNSNLNPSIYGQWVTFTAALTDTGGSAPTGKAAFTWSGYAIRSATPNNGVATLPKTNLNADAYPLTALYSGDATNQGSTVGNSESGGDAGHELGHNHFVTEPVHSGSGGDFHCDDYIADGFAHGTGYALGRTDGASNSPTSQRQNEIDHLVLAGRLNCNQSDLLRRLQYCEEFRVRDAVIPSGCSSRSRSLAG
jgi:hypothetical protein